jgi:hypothetical protein
MGLHLCYDLRLPSHLRSITSPTAWERCTVSR